MRSADYYQIDLLFEKCKSYILEKLSYSNAFILYEFITSEICCAEMESQIKEYIEKNFMECTKYFPFLEISLETFTLFLKSSNLIYLNENYLLNIINKWISFDTKNRQSHQSLLYNYINWQLVSNNNNNISSSSTTLLSSSSIQIISKSNLNYSFHPPLRLHSMLPIMYIVGGYKHPNSVLKTMLSFSLENNSFTELATLNIPRGSPAIASLNNHIIVAGGENGNSFIQSVESYDIYSNTWKNICPLNKARYGGMMTNISIYIIIIIFYV